MLFEAFAFISIPLKISDAFSGGILSIYDVSFNNNSRFVLFEKIVVAKDHRLRTLNIAFDKIDSRQRRDFGDPRQGI